MAISAQKNTAFNFGFKAMPHQEYVMKLKFVSATADIAVRILLHKNTFYLFTATAKMPSSGFERNLLALLLLHGVPP